MRIREIAEITRKSEDSILRAVRRFLPDLAINPGVPVDLNEFQSYVVLKSLESAHHVQVPQSAGQPPHLAGLPSGAQLRELRAAVDRGIITPEQFQLLLGLRPDFTVERPAAPALPSREAASFPSHARQAYAIGSRILAGRHRSSRVPAGQGWLPMPEVAGQ